MKTRFLTRDETEKVVDWLMRWRGFPEEARQVERLFVPADWTLGAFADDGRLLAAGGIYPTIQGSMGFMGKVIANPDAGKLETASAIRALVPAMEAELKKTGCLVAMSIYGERPMARIAANGLDVTDVYLVMKPLEN